MDETYAYNGIIIGVLVGILVMVKVNVVLGIIVAIAVSAACFFIIRMIETLIGKGVDAASDAIHGAIDRKRNEENSASIVKSDNNDPYATFTQKSGTQEPGMQGYWTCPKCHKSNADYVGTCSCGYSKF